MAAVDFPDSGAGGGGADRPAAAVSDPSAGPLTATVSDAFGDELPPDAVPAGPDGGPEGADGAGGGPPRHARRRPSRRRVILEWVAVILVALGVAVLVRTFVVQTFFIPSASMEPTLQEGDRILVDKLSYHLHGVGRGDIVVFAKPGPRCAPVGRSGGRQCWPAADDPGVSDLVKRVIGLPGETISATGGRVYIDGHRLNEPWLPPGTPTYGLTTTTIPAGYYFVMGDNRTDSSDSRVFGPIPGSLIVGRVVVRIWPLSRLHIF